MIIPFSLSCCYCELLWPVRCVCGLLIRVCHVCLCVCFHSFGSQYVLFSARFFYRGGKSFVVYLLMDLAIAFPHIVCLMTQHHLTACASVQSFIFVMCTRNTELIKINIKESIKYSKKKFNKIFDNTSTFHDTFLFVDTVTLFSRNFGLKMMICVSCFFRFRTLHLSQFLNSKFIDTMLFVLSTFFLWHFKYFPRSKYNRWTNADHLL